LRTGFRSAGKAEKRGGFCHHAKKLPPVEKFKFRFHGNLEEEWPSASLADKAWGSPQSSKASQSRQIPALRQTWPAGRAAWRAINLPLTAASAPRTV
jgi:hypothetical protein